MSEWAELLCRTSQECIQIRHSCEDVELSHLQYRRKFFPLRARGMPCHASIHLVRRNKIWQGPAPYLHLWMCAEAPRRLQVGLACLRRCTQQRTKCSRSGLRCCWPAVTYFLVTYRRTQTYVGRSIKTRCMSSVCFTLHFAVCLSLRVVWNLYGHPDAAKWLGFLGCGYAFQPTLLLQTDRAEFYPINLYAPNPVTIQRAGIWRILCWSISVLAV